MKRGNKLPIYSPIPTTVSWKENTIRKSIFIALNFFNATTRIKVLGRAAKDQKTEKK